VPDGAILIVGILFLLMVGYCIINVGWQLSELSRHKVTLVDCYLKACQDDVVHCRKDFEKKVSYARSIGFTNYGLWNDIGRPSAHIFIDLWLDGLNTTLLEIAVLVLPRGQTRCHLSCKSRFDDNTVIVTNNLSGYPDLSGAVQMEAHPRDVTMKQLVQRHHERLGNQERKALIFRPKSLIEDYHAIEEIRVAGLVRNGYARYCDSEHTQWRYSLWGAIILKLSMTFRRKERAN